MSIQLIRQYQRELSQIRQLGATNELALKRPFSNLLQAYCQKKNLILVEEQSIKSKLGNAIRPDGVVKGLNRMDWGYWESKDEADDINEEITKKLTKGYPDDNILFEDTQYAILIQEGRRISESKMQNGAEDLDKLLLQFINFERPEYRAFREAIDNFKKDLPPIIKALRELMEREATNNTAFTKARDKFLKICQESINPAINVADIREMIVQHILTEDIFTTIFDESDFHRSNNIARELETVINTFFRKDVKRNFLQEVRFYYEAIRNAGSRIADTREKQNFLKVIYEDFYKAYNPKGADRLGIVYTPNEIVRFMIESTDHLLYEHFGKDLLSKGVEILDPAVGTGTFITDLIDYFPASKKEQIQYKYQHELHANEVSILPYYIANLNIEFAYQQKTGQYLEFENLCFVDTLDNMGFGYAGKQTDMFGVSAENTERIKRQNERKISVIIGNPPYNAKQENYNYQNANRTYQKIDDEIKNSFVKYGTAQNQIVLYDMYVRFVRWAINRISENGIVSFITNNSFIDSKAFDGFRKVVAEQFNELWIINLKGDARTSGEQRQKEGGNVFSDKIREGIAIYFFIKNAKKSSFKIHYTEIKDYKKAEDKKAFLSEKNNSNSFRIQELEFTSIRPDAKHNWINQTDNDFDSLIPLIDKEVKAGKKQEAIFQYFSRGLETNRQDWAYDFSKEDLVKKTKFTIDVYQKQRQNKSKELPQDIKWSRELAKHLSKDVDIKFNENKVIEGFLKPYCKQFVYLDEHLNSYIYDWEIYNKSSQQELFIAIPGLASPKDFHTLIIDKIIDLNALPAGVQCLPLYRYENGVQVENITDWALDLFRKRYSTSQRNGISLSKTDIFHYVYAVLHNPAYRTKYEQNLKRDFPRIPLYDDFDKWASWGKALMDLHLHYETVAPYPLERIDTTLKSGSLNKPKLKADKTIGEIVLDEQTTLKGIPAEAWEYKLGNRSALEWILDQYKESKPSDPTIAEKFNTYRFSDYKEQVIDLLCRVCTVSVKTVEIVDEMKAYG